jgi:hypothetical protein
MRLLKVFGILLCGFALVAVAVAGGKSLGVRDSYRIRFDSPVRVGTDLLPAGDYTIRHIMEGQDHIMVFQSARGKGPAVRVKCTLVPLGQKAQKTSTTYVLNAASERVLHEMTFRGDTEKHVF